MTRRQDKPRREPRTLFDQLAYPAPSLSGQCDLCPAVGPVTVRRCGPGKAYTCQKCTARLEATDAKKSKDAA